MAKKVVYTAITNGYDKINEPTFISKGWDYVLLSDKHLESENWEVVKIRKGASQKSHRRNKIFNPYIFSNYEESLYIDGNIIIDCEIDSLYKEWRNHDMVVMEHPERDCLYDEAQRCIELNKDKSDIILSQVSRYRKKYYPENNGLVATGILYRKHTRAIKLFSETWKKEVIKGSHRDQLSFNYSAHVANVDYKTVPYKYLLESKFKKITHTKPSRLTKKRVSRTKKCVIFEDSLDEFRKSALSNFWEKDNLIRRANEIYDKVEVCEFNNRQIAFKFGDIRVPLEGYFTVGN